MARACGLELGAWGFHRQAWRLERLAVDRDPWAMLSPFITHDLELSCDSLELPSGCAFNFYCKFFHGFVYTFQWCLFRGLELEAWGLGLGALFFFLFLFNLRLCRARIAAGPVFQIILISPIVPCIVWESCDWTSPGPYGVCPSL